MSQLPSAQSPLHDAVGFLMRHPVLPYLPQVGGVESGAADVVCFDNKNKILLLQLSSARRSGRAGIACLPRPLPKNCKQTGALFS